MEYYQHIQNRSQQTVAVINTYVPNLKVGLIGSAELSTQSTGLDNDATVRDQRLTVSDAAVNAEAAGFALIVKMDLALAAAASAELDEEVPAEAALLSLLDPVYAIVPVTTEAAVRRGHKLVAALQKIDSYLAGLQPPRGPIISGGRGLNTLILTLGLQPGLEQTVENTGASATEARSILRSHARGVDRLNKRCYQKLQAEARDNSALAEALAQIQTDDANLPATLGIRTILQGGAGGLQLLISYDNASYDDALENTLEWMVTDVDADFTNSTPVDPSGNAIGPFTAGQEVKLRSRTRNANGTTTGSVRTLTIQPPA